MDASRKSYFTKLASLLSEKHKVKVIVGGMSAKTDGKTVFIPDPDNFIGVDNKIVEGFIDHEIAHVHFTRKGIEAMAMAKDKQLLNVLEDVRVEYKMAEKFRGSKKYLLALEDYCDKQYPIQDPTHIKYRNMQRYMAKKITRKNGLLSDAVCDVLDKVKLRNMTTLKMAELSNTIYDILNAEFKAEQEAKQESDAPSSFGTEGETQEAQDNNVDATGQNDNNAKDGEQQIDASGQGDNESDTQKEIEKFMQGLKDQEKENDEESKYEVDDKVQEENADNYTQHIEGDFKESRNLMQNWVEMAQSGNEYSPITEFDIYRPAKYSPSVINKKEYLSDGLIVASRLKGVFDAVGRKNHDSTKGRINPKNIYRLLTPNNTNPKVCIESQKDITQDIAISIAVDASGSMDSISTLKGLIPLCIGLEALKIKFSVFSFDAIKDGQLTRKAHAKERLMPFVNVRDLAVNITELKGPNLPVSAEYIRERYRAWGGTPTADAIIHGHKLLKTENAKYKLLFVFTDGKPTTSGCSEVSKLIDKQRDVITIGVGLGYGVSQKSMSDIFGHRQFCSTSYNVPMPQFCTELRKVLERCI